ncbi:hypothetical protein FisN_28Hh100 [Fistulifera solaris]|uniref:DOT1 domain-containing protein n=1 Tax=Fistulifera solaris TaxID=1519565 RepID=A0A1Z5KHV1_FISSO|nr:hypothetical protein FisN_28Hh100 [Fistulifera solaris]|eukprot:GAX25621.1 hypothetical protein FisN_28Hh100 [Fistulifera solaris]
MSSRKSDPPESVLKRWMGFMTNSISRSSISSEGTQEESEASGNDRKTKLPIAADSDTKRSRFSDTPHNETRDNQPSPVSPAQSPLVSENDMPEEAKAATKQRLDKVFQSIASNDVTPSYKTSESSQSTLNDASKPSSKHNSFASSVADDDSSIVILGDCKQANLQSPKEANGSRKLQAYRRSIYESVRRESSLSSEKSSEDSNNSQDSGDSSIITVKEPSPRRRQSHPQHQVNGLGRLFPDLFDPKSDQDSSVVVLESFVHRYERSRSSTSDSSAESDNSSAEQKNGKRYDDSVTRRHSSTSSYSNADSSIKFVKQCPGRHFDTSVGHRRSSSLNYKSDSDESVVFLKQSSGTRYDCRVARPYSDMSECKSDTDSSVEYLKSTCHHSSASECDSSVEYIMQYPGKLDNNARNRHRSTYSDSEPGSFIQYIKQSPGEKCNSSVARSHSSTSGSSQSGCSVEVVEQSPGGRFNNVDARHTASTSNQSSSPASNDAQRSAPILNHSSSPASYDEEYALQTGQNDCHGRGDQDPKATSPEKIHSAGSGSSSHSLRRKRINRRLLARRPTCDPFVQYTGPAKKRKKSLANLTPQFYKLDHRNPDMFLSASGPTAHRLSHERVLVLAKNPTKPIEGLSDLVEHTAQMYKFDNFHQMMIVAQVTDAPPNGLFSLEDFKVMWASAEDDFDKTTEEIEEGDLVRAANRYIGRDESPDQEAAQYGRLLPDATDNVFRSILDLRKNDVFMDIGHGIGNNVLQAAYTFGCKSRGLELVEDRNTVATQFKANLEGQLSALRIAKSAWTWEVGDVELRRGRLEDESNRNFITALGTARVKALANNFNGVFADRCLTSNQKYFLDNYISGLFADMVPGSIIATLHPLLDLPPSFSAVTERRSRHNMKCNEDASFYKLKKIVIGRANECVSWSAGGSNKHDITVYRYKRLRQCSRKAVFMCSNPFCQKALDNIPIPATKKVTVDTPMGSEVRVVMNYCDCNFSGNGLRQRRSDDCHSK